MPRLTPLKPQEVIRKLVRLGYEGPYPGGRHQRMVNLETGKVIPVPFHKGRDVSVGLVAEIIRELGISREDWFAL
ncbi:MAG TPA: type II toxin-antitoxin system HicA family toxin [candidate division WOR-3 bacterium]|uniref:Type II toxin-antitoxin system HicA family toxin n=1 Tax=candidate division WOR-3 bacterium TaxID=2052148 RepID=A0A7V0T4M5_UNCW3|nr:type II toxin-antitoxin system HicA family toxin [candidate division WOR-3 bacterium]